MLTFIPSSANEPAQVVGESFRRAALPIAHRRDRIGSRYMVPAEHRVVDDILLRACCVTPKTPSTGGPPQYDRIDFAWNHLAAAGFT
jgi:hypothetical protein